MALVSCVLVVWGLRVLGATLGLSGLAMIMLLGGMYAPFVLGRYCWQGLIVPATIGIRCPECSSRPLIFVSCVSFGYRYYRCGSCLRRFKRPDLDEPWEDANGALDLPFYQPKPKFALGANREWAWAGVFLGALLLWPLAGAVGFWFGGMPGSVAGSFVGFGLVTSIYRVLVRRKEADHQREWRATIDGLA